MLAVSGDFTLIAGMQITALGSCDVLKEATTHLLKGGRVSGHHVEDLRKSLTDCLGPQQLQQFDSMMLRMDTMCAAAHKVSLFVLLF